MSKVSRMLKDLDAINDSIIVTYGKLGSGQDQKQKEFSSEPAAKKFKDEMEAAGYTVSVGRK